MSAAERLGPVGADERIVELDVVRGLALLGIFLMNVEFFNRSVFGIGEGMPEGLTGADWVASFVIAYFVQGKFWTMFSMLFGMGFAVMLTRAERQGRPFIGPYLRRILALAVFGALHYILLWEGDILFSYAVGASGLLIVLYGKWKPIVIAIVVMIALAFVPNLGPIGVLAGSLAFIGLVSLFLRVERKVWRMPVFAFIFLILGVLGAIAATAFWVIPGAPKDPRAPVTGIAAMFLLTAYLATRYHQPKELRTLRLGVWLYALPLTMMTVMGAVQYFGPPDPADPAQIIAQPNETVDKEVRERRATRAKRLEDRKEKMEKEIRTFSRGSYAEGVEYRARDFPKKIPDDGGFAVVVIGMFLIGVWLVRSGAMENPRAHLPMFRRLAFIATPIGVGLGLVSALIATRHTVGDSHDGFQLARGLSSLANLPACLGYVGLVVVALNSDTVFRKIRVLAPAGRMALTNYLTQTLISTIVFYGWGAGQWGLARAWQAVFVLAVFTLQVLFSHWWLARFRYGPMEWVWRAFTYRKLPAMRLGDPVPVAASV